MSSKITLYHTISKSGQRTQFLSC